MKRGKTPVTGKAAEAYVSNKSTQERKARPQQKGPIRPTKFDREKRLAYLDLLAAGGRRCASAVTVGISVKTVERAIASDPDFASALSQAEMLANEKVEDAMFQTAINGNVVAQQVWLYNRAPDKWADRRQLSGPKGGPIAVTFGAPDLSKLSEQELRDLEKLLGKATPEARGL